MIYEFSVLLIFDTKNAFSGISDKIKYFVDERIDVKQSPKEK